MGDLVGVGDPGGVQRTRGDLAALNAKVDAEKRTAAIKELTNQVRSLEASVQSLNSAVLMDYYR